MDTTLYHPVATCDIPMPIVESETDGAKAQLPRILLQAVGTRAASRRVFLMTMIFLAIAAVEAALLMRLPSPEPLVVYHEDPRQNLVELLK